MRQWKPTDIESYKAAWISVYGIHCHGRNIRFLEVLLSDIEFIENFDFLANKPERLDVLSYMVFTKSVEPIRSKVTVSMNGGWNSLMLIEDITMRTEAKEDSFSEDNSSSEFEKRSTSSE